MQGSDELGYAARDEKNPSLQLNYYNNFCAPREMAKKWLE